MPAFRCELYTCFHCGKWLNKSPGYFTTPADYECGRIYCELNRWIKNSISIFITKLTNKLHTYKRKLDGTNHEDH